MIVVTALWCIAAVAPARAQEVPRVSRYDLPKVYREARMQKLIEQVLAKDGEGIRPLPPEHLTSPADTISEWLAPFLPGYEPPVPETPGFVVERVKRIKRIERQLYANRFNDVKWAYLGNSKWTALDTTWTKHLRARLQAKFGAPTKTLVELDYAGTPRREEYIQFEYWFLLNDSIPLIVMDVNGPFDRGLVVASDQKYRDQLFDIRQAFLSDLMEHGSLAPYVDYYFHYASRRWYRTGFDGRQFFVERIGEPNLARGRPQLRMQSDGR